MGLLISRPSVFVWGPEACLSTGFRGFCEKARPLWRKMVFAVASIEYKMRILHKDMEENTNTMFTNNMLQLVTREETKHG